MSLFNWKKKRETSGCACSCGHKTYNTAKNETINSPNDICSIKVLGAGCASCHQLYKNTQEAIIAAHLPIEAEYITDLEKVMAYGAMSMPVLVINEKIVSMGKILKTNEIKKILEKYDLP